MADWFIYLTEQGANHSLRTDSSNQNLFLRPDFLLSKIFRLPPPTPPLTANLSLPEGWKSIAELLSAQTSLVEACSAAFHSALHI